MPGSLVLDLKGIASGFHNSRLCVPWQLFSLGLRDFRMSTISELPRSPPILLRHPDHPTVLSNFQLDPAPTLHAPRILLLHQSSANLVRRPDASRSQFYYKLTTKKLYIYSDDVTRCNCSAFRTFSSISKLSTFVVFEIGQSLWSLCHSELPHIFVVNSGDHHAHPCRGNPGLLNVWKCTLRLAS